MTQPATLDPELDDGALLWQFAMYRSQAAFEQVAKRHLGLVYSTALRRTRSTALAEDVTQAVFIVLTGKAASLRKMKTIGGWLLKVTRYCAIDAMRKETRHRNHELRAAAERAERVEEITPAADLSPLLDDAMLRLSAADRNAVVLRYFQDQSYSSIGKVLGLDEDAARKRVGRAIVKLRDVLARRGAALSDDVLTHSLTNHASAVAVPQLILASILSASSSTIPQSGLALAIAKGATKMMTIAKIKAAAAVGGIALLAAGGTGMILLPTLLAQNAAPSTTPSTNPTSAPAAEAPNPARTTAMITATKADIASLELALDAFEIDTGRYPSTTEGLSALVNAPSNLTGWRGPYVRKVPTDPWGLPYRYMYPGTHQRGSYDLSSNGADKQLNTADDITNWPSK